MIALSGAAQLKRAAYGVAKLSVAFALIFWAIDSGMISVAGLWQVVHRPVGLAQAFLLIAASLALGALRWQLLLGHQNVSLSFPRTFRLTILAAAAGVFLPGQIGGDAVRAAWIWRDVREQRTLALMSIPIDRALGLLGLFLVGSILTPIVITDRLGGADLNRLVFLANGVVAIAVVGLVLFWMVAIRGEREPVQRKGTVSRMWDALRAYGTDPFLMIRLVLLSVIGHGLSIFAFLVISQQSGVGSLGALDHAVAMILSLLANMIPFSPGGIGIGEAAFDSICRLLSGGEVASYATIFLAYRAVSMMTLAALTLPVWLIQPGQSGTINSGTEITPPAVPRSIDGG